MKKRPVYKTGIVKMNKDGTGTITDESRSVFFDQWDNFFKDQIRIFLNNEIIGYIMDDGPIWTYNGW